MKLLRSSVMGGCALFVCSLPLHAEDLTVNRLIASQCAQCHGTNGHAVGDIDGLAGKSFDDLYKKLEDLLFEDRAENIMGHQAMGYTADQLRRVAQYYASLPRADDQAGNQGEHDD